METDKRATGRSRRRMIALAVVAVLGLGAGIAGVTSALAGTTGAIVGTGGKCVDVAGAKSADGTAVQLYPCNGTSAQQWTVDGGAIKALGKCLDVAGGGTANGSKVQLYTCNGTGAQMWTAGGGMLRNQQSHRCLDATGVSAGNGTRLQIWDCTGGTNQNWIMPGRDAPAPRPSVDPSPVPSPSLSPTAAPTTPAPTTGTGAFVHPGVLVSRAQLDFVKAKVNAGAQPWKSAYDQMMRHPLASQSRAPNPRATVECGSYSNPNNGCTDERQDALAAYANALAWYITGDSRYADKAISIMNAWSAVIKNHTNSNAPLQTGWAGSTWPRAAEIIRYTYNGWASADIDRFSTMLRTVYLPEVIKGSGGNGNWELSMMEAAAGIAVFLDDRTAYNKAITRFTARVPAYVYLTSDGAYPKSPPGTTLSESQTVSLWQGQSTFVDGLAQETCRDFVHTGYGLTAIVHVAETTRIQGEDLYPQVKTRLAAALELHASFELGAAVPSWLCGGSVKKGLGPATEVGYNALGNRLGMSLPNTKTLTQSRRPAQTNVLFVGWDTLTHADNPD